MWLPKMSLGFRAVVFRNLERNLALKAQTQPMDLQVRLWSKAGSAGVRGLLSSIDVPQLT